MTTFQIEKPKRIKSRRSSPADEVAELTTKRARRLLGSDHPERPSPQVSVKTVNPAKAHTMIRYDVLGQLVKQRRAKDGLSLRAVARETGISASTLSRIENGNTADAEQVITLTRWIGIAVERLSGSLSESVPQQIKAIILADPKLTPDEREALCSTFSVLYRQMANG